MNVLHLIDRLNEGAGRVVQDLVENSDVDSFVCALHSEGNMNHKFKNAVYLDITGGVDAFFKVYRLLKNWNIDVLHTHNVDAYEYGVLAGWFAGVKVVHTAHGRSIKRGWRRTRERLYHKIVSLFVDKYVAVSSDLAIFCRRNWSLKKVYVVHNGIDTEQYKPKNVKWNYVEGVKKGEKKVGIVAGLRRVKDHVTLIKAMKKVVLKEKAKLLIIGDGAERGRLERFVSEIGMSDHVLFLGNRSDVVGLFNYMDVAVLSSLSECLSITLLEGMACGVPYVATNVGGNSCVIRNGENGILVPVRDPDKLAEGILGLFQGVLNERFGRAAKKTVVERFSVGQMVDKYDRMYHKLICRN